MHLCWSIGEGSQKSVGRSTMINYGYRLRLDRTPGCALDNSTHWLACFTWTRFCGSGWRRLSLGFDLPGQISAHLCTQNPILVYILIPTRLEGIYCIIDEYPLHCVVMVSISFSRLKPYMQLSYSDSNLGSQDRASGNMVQYTPPFPCIGSSCLLSSLYPPSREYPESRLHPLIVDRRFRNCYRPHGIAWTAVFVCDMLQ